MNFPPTGNATVSLPAICTVHKSICPVRLFRGPRGEAVAGVAGAAGDANATPFTEIESLFVAGYFQ